MTNSSTNRIVAAISDSATCMGLANCLAIPSSASTRQISFLINRVAISIIATYSNNRISRHEAVGAIQSMKCCLKKVGLHSNASKKWGADSKPPWDQTAVLRDRAERGSDLSDPVSQRTPDTSSSISTERSKHCGDDTNGDDHVLERHHAVLVRAQTLQRFCGLNIIPQHRRKILLQVDLLMVRQPCLPTGLFI